MVLKSDCSVLHQFLRYVLATVILQGWLLVIMSIVSSISERRRRQLIVIGAGRAACICKQIDRWVALFVTQKPSLRVKFELTLLVLYACLKDSMLCYAVSKFCTSWMLALCWCAAWPRTVTAVVDAWQCVIQSSMAFHWHSCSRSVYLQHVTRCSMLLLFFIEKLSAQCVFWQTRWSYLKNRTS